MKPTVKHTLKNNEETTRGTKETLKLRKDTDQDGERLEPSTSITTHCVKSVLRKEFIPKQMKSITYYLYQEVEPMIWIISWLYVSHVIHALVFWMAIDLVGVGGSKSLQVIPQGTEGAPHAQKPGFKWGIKTRLILGEK